MPGCGCSDVGGGGGGSGCSFSQAGNVTFGGSCEAGITGDVSVSELLSSIATGALDECASFQIPVFQGGAWKLATVSRLRCARIV